jgi:hypothetical protein
MIREWLESLSPEIKHQVLAGGARRFYGRPALAAACLPRGQGGYRKRPASHSRGLTEKKPTCLRVATHPEPRLVMPESPGQCGRQDSRCSAAPPSASGRSRVAVPIVKVTVKLGRTGS